jgi:hypothetical protein
MAGDERIADLAQASQRQQDHEGAFTEEPARRARGEFNNHTGEMHRRPRLDSTFFFFFAERKSGE